MINKSKKRVRECLALFAPLGNIRSRTQFGGFSLSADRVMFALVSDGELYLRADKETEVHFRRKKMERLIYRKRGMDVQLRYFKVSPAQWSDPEALCKLGRLALQGMQRDIAVRKNNEAGRLKDLPNLTLALERMLWQAGIENSGDLRLHGACQTYLKLCAIKKKNLGINLLMALEGAILGFHEAALPMASRESLTHWFNHQQEQQSTILH
ncbi:MULTISPECIES: TfoX/Sxy family DNA transformation protein [Rahnella]|jgi:DNA transformation protein|uniref:TfoX/Sxy family DNA transformation protein n=1 Tax=Rahnella victoriana TaxID=1510570 RepID=A0ABS0DVY8_9GAMM|nr:MULTISPECIES: TfoX/Sxy family DNA transformation protein [Rahnella]VTQ61182.1 Regulator of competence-specific genes [Campylobacter jejuni]MBF7956288.1 TfoX/Sxy family DNA transformation protein [Rahnella victoriana]TBX33992.1 TfoX/Sxy family DNA transformation protein [Rahnella victoriana]TDS87843.1 regulator of competence-specific genes [Rahnella sp. BIGb0236]UHM89707.1 TfoX/Sxy family DNA transformation protein [Rahnella victoriana]